MKHYNTYTTNTHTLRICFLVKFNKQRNFKPSPDQYTLYRNCATIYLHCPDTVPLQVSSVPNLLLHSFATWCEIVAKHHQLCLATVGVTVAKYLRHFGSDLCHARPDQVEIGDSNSHRHITRGRGCYSVYYKVHTSAEGTVQKYSVYLRDRLHIFFRQQ